MFLSSTIAFSMVQPYQEGNRYLYQRRVADKIESIYWQVFEKEDLISIDVSEEKKSFTNLCTKTGQTVKWTTKEEGKHDIVAKRIGNTIQITGTRLGERVNETVKIDKRAWYQPLSYSLGSFLESDEQSISFWVIRADKIEVVALQATKKGEELLKFNNEEVPAQKVEIRPDGLLSALWVGTYWYRKSDNLFLRYQAVHGLPGTAETTVKLKEIIATDPSPSSSKTNMHP